VPAAGPDAALDQSDGAGDAAGLGDRGACGLTGGNCALTTVGETIEAHGVTIMGPLNLPSTVPLHASQMFSKNIETVLKHLMKDGSLNIDLSDQITGAMTFTPAGNIRRR
jgi:proton-translocating NAD(P)+ transhydrogenase subunit alpha